MVSSEHPWSVQVQNTPPQDSTWCFLCLIWKTTSKTYCIISAMQNAEPAHNKGSAALYSSLSHRGKAASSSEGSVEMCDGFRIYPAMPTPRQIPPSSSLSLHKGTWWDTVNESRERIQQWGRGCSLGFASVFPLFGRISSLVWFTAGPANSCAGTTEGEGTNKEMSC